MWFVRTSYIWSQCSFEAKTILRRLYCQKKKFVLSATGKNVIGKCNNITQIIIKNIK
jgi:hypothetical protein